MISYIITYRYLKEREGRIEDCIKNIRKYMDEHDELIVVDQSETPSEFDCDKYIFTPKSEFNKAMAGNDGIKASKNPYIALWDIDIRVSEEVIKKIKSTIRQNSFMVFDVYEDGKLLFGGSSGFLLVFDKNLIDKIGYYDEDYKGYGYEDVDFSMRMVEAGAEKIYENDRIEHIKHIRGFPKQLEEIKKNEKIYNEKLAGRKQGKLGLNNKEII